MTKPALPTRLLVIDAEDETRTFLRRRFTRMGHEVMETADHAKVLSLIAMIPFDLVLLDLRTPGPGGACGLDLLRRIRETRGSAELPVLAIAPDMAREEAVEALALGADDCLVRPLSIEIAHARVEMLISRRHELPARDAARYDLQTRIESLEEAADRSEAVSAGLMERGHDVAAPLNGLVSAAAVLTAICKTPRLTGEIETIDAAVGVLDLVIARALGRADRRHRAPKSKISVLLADDDSVSRTAIHELLRAAEVEVELVEAATGLDAALAADCKFFDLVVVNLTAPEAIAGIRAIRRAERHNSTRRTPILAVGAKGYSSVETLHAGADLCMCEPVTAERVLNSLAESLVREAQDVCAVA